MATSRRARGDGGLHWDAKRQRFIAAKTVGYTAAGKRIVRRGSGKTEAQALAKLKQAVSEYEAGLPAEGRHYTIARAVEDWLAYGLAGRDEATIAKCTSLCRTHIIPELGARTFRAPRELTASDVDKWLARKAKMLSTRTLQELYQCLSRTVNRAMARGYAPRNVVTLCSIPRGRAGRPSKSLTLDQAQALIGAAEASRLYAYVVLSLLIGARTEELRALVWDHVDLDGRPDADPPVPPSVELWRSVREGGDTKTRKSRRTLALPARCVTALRRHHQQQDADRERAGNAWQATRLVFATSGGTALDAHNVRRSFRAVVKAAGLDPDKWTPRELRHSFVSLLSADGVPLETIADLCGHDGTRVTEKVYRHQLRPVLLTAATVMDRIFGEGTEPAA